MNQSINWQEKAARNLSDGFTRTENIDMLADAGLDRIEAEEITDSLIEDSRKKGTNKLIKGGLIFLGGIIALAVITAGFQEMPDRGRAFRLPLIILGAGILFLSDGIRRLSSLKMITKA